jgi:integrase
MKLKYLVSNNGSLYYQRSIPVKLQAHPTFGGRKLYRKPLKASSNSDADVLAAWTACNDVFKDLTRTLTLANSDVIEYRELMKLAESYLKANNLSPGELAPDPRLSDTENRLILDKRNYDVFERSLFREREDWDSDMFQNDARSDPMPHSTRVIDYAWKLINEPRSDNTASRVLCLSDCWGIYSDLKGLDEENRSVKKSKSRWLRMIELSGDSIVSQESVHAALDSYVAARESADMPPKGSSIAREMASLLAVLNAVIRKRRLPIVITKPLIKNASDYKQRYTFNPEEQAALVAQAADTTSKAYQPWKELAILLMAQSGCIASELQRLRTENLNLDDVVPHVVFTGELKTKNSERVNPLVYRVERIRELVAQIEDESGYVFGKAIANTTESNVSHQLSKLCKKVNEEATAYSNRHTFRAKAHSNGVDALSIALLGGWSGSDMGINTVMKNYGHTGQKHKEALEQLQRAMKQANSYLLSEEAEHESNVTRIRTSG